MGTALMAMFPTFSLANNPGGTINAGKDAAGLTPPPMPDMPAMPTPPPPPPSFSQANISAAAMQARKVASLAGASATVATSPSGVASPAQTTKQYLGG